LLVLIINSTGYSLSKNFNINLNLILTVYVLYSARHIYLVQRQSRLLIWVEGGCCGNGYTYIGWRTYVVN
jgi:hypothetical protein